MMAVNKMEEDSRMLVRVTSSGMVVLNRYRESERLNLGLGQLGTKKRRADSQIEEFFGVLYRQQVLRDHVSLHASLDGTFAMVYSPHSRPQAVQLSGLVKTSHGRGRHVFVILDRLFGILACRMELGRWLLWWKRNVGFTVVGIRLKTWHLQPLQHVLESSLDLSDDGMGTAVHKISAISTAQSRWLAYPSSPSTAMRSLLALMHSMPKRWHREHPARPRSQASHLTLSFRQATHARPLRDGWWSAGEVADGLCLDLLRAGPSSIVWAECRFA